ncbi:MAG: PaaI family thioesterase [Proteobacteria bacterium]|nr:PaaI family thioesterase [Pseudomonadota bacterium]
MTTDELIKILNANRPPAMQTLGGEVLKFDTEENAATVRFTAGSSLCNQDGGIQGGFICGMLDAAMANAVFCLLGDVAIVATLEIKVSYLEVSRQGELFARGTVIRSGKTVTFLEAELRDADGKLLATASSTARVIRKN